MRENIYQRRLIKKLKKQFPGCMVLKNDANYIQGIPDLMILHNDKWAALECKHSEDASHQPNQDLYVNKMNSMSYAAFIYPENEKEIFNNLQSAFKFKR